jgi:archaemetzincin
MKKTIILFLVGIVAFIFNGCTHGSQKEPSECLEDSLPADPPLGYVIELRPLGDFSKEKAKQVRAEFVKQLASLFPDQPKSWLETSIYVSENKEIPASCLYKPRNRYWAGAILRMLHNSHGGNPDIVTIGLTNRDISTSIHGQYNFGVMGLSLRPGDASVVSTYRLKRKDDLWKVAMHEFLHSRGMPHCKKDDVKCLMQDAHTKNTFYMKHTLCADCQNTLKKITF